MTTQGGNLYGEGGRASVPNLRLTNEFDEYLLNALEDSHLFGFQEDKEFFPKAKVYYHHRAEWTGKSMEFKVDHLELGLNVTQDGKPIPNFGVIKTLSSMVFTLQAKMKDLEERLAKMEDENLCLHTYLEFCFPGERERREEDIKTIVEEKKKAKLSQQSEK